MEANKYPFSLSQFELDLLSHGVGKLQTDTEGEEDADAKTTDRFSASATYICS